jgi:hypothetical protein
MLKSVALGAMLMLGVATVSNAAILPVPTDVSGEGVLKVAQGCGPGGWRGPYGHCHWGGGPGPYYGAAPGWGYGRHCWRGAYGYLHCN